MKLPNNKSITKFIIEKTGLPAFIDNDSEIALAELRFSAAKGVKNARSPIQAGGVSLVLMLDGELTEVTRDLPERSALFHSF